MLQKNQLNNTEKMRITYLDVAKGILIILLVFAHFESAINRLPYVSPYFTLVYGWNNIFTCFYMPAFFIISGFCSNFNKPFGKFILSIIKTLFLPLVAFTLINQAAAAAISGDNYFDHLVQHISNGGGLWFLQAMIIAKLILYGLRKVKLNGGGYLIVCLILMILGVLLSQYGIGKNWCFYQHALIAVFWLAVGQWLKENPFTYERLLKWSLYAYPIVAIASFLKYSSLTASIAISIKTIPLHIAYSLIGTLFLLKMCSFIKENKLLEYWGKNSLVVYAQHFTPLLLLVKYLWGWLQPANWWMFLVFFFVLYTLEYGVCWLLMKLFNFRPFSYLVGKF